MSNKRLCLMLHKPEHVRGCSAGSFKLSFCAFNGDTTEWSDWSMVPHQTFADVELRCHWNLHMIDGMDRYRFYAVVNNTFLDHMAAERAVKALRKIEKARKDVVVHPKTFGQFVAGIMQALKVKTLLDRDDQRECGYWEYETREVQFVVDRRLDVFREENEPGYKDKDKDERGVA